MSYRVGYGKRVILSAKVREAHLRGFEVKWPPIILPDLVVVVIVMAAASSGPLGATQ